MPVRRDGESTPSGASTAGAVSVGDEPAVDGGLDRRRLGHVVGLVLLVSLVGVFVATAVPQAVGTDHSYVVLSDSMSPAIDAGAIVFVSEVPTDHISEGDVITYESGASGDAGRVTHRVVGVVDDGGDRRFRTKGDANEDPDSRLVSSSQVVGVVSFHVPYAGYVTSFANTKLGTVALVIVPAILLVVSELWDLLAAKSSDSGEKFPGTGGAD